MTKADIAKIGFLATSDENWKAVQEVLTSLWEKVFQEPEAKKGKK